MNYHAVIFRPYTDISGVFTTWMEKCDDFLVVEHPADGKTKRIHCHVLMINCKVKKEQFRRYAKVFIALGDKDLWISDHVLSGEFKGEPISRQETAKYMLKGKFVEKLQNKFSKEELEGLRNAWQSRQQQPSKVSVTPEPKVQWKDLLDEMLKEVNRYESLYENKKILGHRVIADIVCYVLRRHNAKFGIYQVREFMSSILYDSERHRDSFLDKVCEGFQ